MASATALIVGGGVIGLSTAYHLARKGFGRIVVLEKDAIGVGSSRRVAGIITGHLWSETGVRARQIALALYRELSDDLPGYRFQDVGCLNLFDPPTWPERAALLPLYDRLAAPYAVLDAQEIRARWPALNPPAELIGLFDPLGGYSEPDEYIPALTQRLHDLGVELQSGRTVRGFVLRGGRVAGVTVDDGQTTTTLEADAVICTTHAWMNLNLAGLPRRVPVKSFVHQRYVTHPLPAAAELPAINANPYGGYVRPAAGKRILAGAETAQRAELRVPGFDFHMDTLDAPPQVADDLRAALTPLLPGLAATTWASRQVGLICFSVDGEPILGPVVGFPGLWIGCAFHSGGFAYNPVAGLLLAQLVSGETPSLDIAAFAPGRFGADQIEEYLATTVTQACAVRRRH